MHRFGKPLVAALLVAGGFVAAACGSSTTSTASSSPGCEQSIDCAADERCDFSDGLCGGGDPGTCVAKPNGCSTGAGPYPFVCGCDGAFHASDCIDTQGADTATDASICHDPPPGTFACGSSRCNTGFFYCMVTGNDRRCVAAPDCSTCDCIADQICAGGTCSQDNGVLTVTCPNGS